MRPRAQSSRHVAQLGVATPKEQPCMAEKKTEVFRQRKLLGKRWEMGKKYAERQKRRCKKIKGRVDGRGEEK